MALFTHRSNRITGLSGLDTESMVRQIMQAESGRLHRLQRNRTRLQWRQEAYHDVASQLRSFHSRFLDIASPTSLRMQRSWNNFSTTVTANNAASNAVTVIPGANARAGTHTIEVNQLATRDRISSQLDTVTGVTAANSKLLQSRDDISSADMDSIIARGLNFNLNLNGTTRNINITAADIAAFPSPVTDPSGLAVLIQEKVDAAFNPGGASRINVSAAGDRISFDPEGNGHTLTISDGAALERSLETGGLLDIPGLNALMVSQPLQSLTINIGGEAFNVEIDTDRFSTLTSENAILNELNRQIHEQLRAEGISTSFEFRYVNNEVHLVDTRGISRYDITIEDETALTGSTLLTYLGFNAPLTLERTSSLSLLNIENGDSNQFGATDRLGDVFRGLGFGGSGEWQPDIGTDEYTFTININNTDIVLRSDHNMNDLVRLINTANAGVTLTHNRLNGVFTLESNTYGDLGNIMLDSNAENFFNTLMGDGGRTPDGYLVRGAGFDQETGKEAIFTLNGVQTTRQSNTFTHEGITFTLNQNVVIGEVITIGIERDNSATIDLIRDFVNAYNELRTNLNNMIHERRARSMGAFFEPLTDEERRAMSEDEIRRWEEQARTGLMHRNDILTRMVNQMRSQLFNGVELPDGTRLSLSQIGISPSSNHEDRGTLVIDEERLAAAIEQHGERIGQMFTTSGGLGERLHNIIDDATHVTRGTISRRAGGTTATNANNDLLRQLAREDERIANVTRQLARREEALFRLFSRMEVSLMQSDSQMNFMMQMFMQ